MSNRNILVKHIEGVFTFDTDKTYSRIECGIVWLPYERSRWFRAWDTKEGFYTNGIFSENYRYLGSTVEDVKDEIYDHLYFDEVTKMIRRKAGTVIRMVSGKKHIKYFTDHKEAINYKDEVERKIIGEARFLTI
jgi:hypothetical protein